MKVVWGLVVALALSGCSTVDEWMGTDMANAEWTKASWWGIGSGEPDPMGKTVKLEESAYTIGTLKEPEAVEVRGARELRMSGATADAAKAAAFKAANETCAKDDMEGLRADVVKDKAGEANGSYFHDIEFNCVKA